MADDTDGVLVDGQQVSLADIAGMTLDDVAEVRGFVFPKGTFHFKAVPGECKLDKVGDKAAARFVLVAKDVIGLAPGQDGVTDEACIGKKFSHLQFIKDRDDLGRLKAFFKDTGFTGNGTLSELITEYGNQEVEFVGSITHTKDKNDSDKVYQNLNTLKLRPMPANGG